MPRVAGLTRLAQVPPVGAVLDVVVGRLAGPAVGAVRTMVARRLPSR